MKNEEVPFYASIIGTNLWNEPGMRVCETIEMKKSFVVRGREVSGRSREVSGRPP